MTLAISTGRMIECLGVARLPAVEDRGRYVVSDGQAISRQRLPGDFTGNATLTISGLVAGTDIVILNAGTDVERINVDANPGTSYAYTYGHAGSTPAIVDIGLFKTGYQPRYIRGLSLPITDAILPVEQLIDRAYANPA